MFGGDDTFTKDKGPIQKSDNTECGKSPKKKKEAKANYCLQHPNH